MLRVFEAFSGYGSQSLALKRLGIEYEVVAISEINPHVVKAYMALHGKTKNLGDIKQVDISEIPDHDLFTYSFPCQDISVAGKQKGIATNTRSGLLWECERVIAHKKPKYLLLENVKNLVGARHKEDFKIWCEWLEEQGYSNYWKVLDAADYGIPQHRERIFMVSILGEHIPYEFPKPFDNGLRLMDLLEQQVDACYYATPQKEEKLYNQFGYDKNVSCLITGEQKHQSVKYNGIAPTLTSAMGCGGGHIPFVNVCGGDNSFRLRKLTPRECFLLMGLTHSEIDSIESANISKTQRYSMAGNSIVVNVLEQLFKNMLMHEKES